jgi:hypothetical protein
MSNLREAAQQALEAIDYLDSHPEGGIDEAETAIEALRAALAQPEPAAPTVVEPIGFVDPEELKTLACANGQSLWVESIFVNREHPPAGFVPIYATPPRTALTVDQAIYALSSALAASKGWLRDYSDGVIRDAIDRREPRTALREAARQALIALEIDAYGEPPRHERNVAINALRDALSAQPEPQSTHSAKCYQWHHRCAVVEVERLRAAPRATLSDAELACLYIKHARCQEEGPITSGWFDFARAVEAAIKEKQND